MTAAGHNDVVMRKADSRASWAYLRAWAVALLCLMPHFFCWAADAEDIAELRRSIETLREENRSLLKRLEALERRGPEPTASPSRLRLSRSWPEASQGGAPEPTSETERQSAANKGQIEKLEQRVKELEMEKTAQEGAVRTIIRDTIAIRGPKINEAASLGGTLSAAVGREKDFAGSRNSTLGLTTIDLEFDIKMSDWGTGHMKIDYLDGKGTQYQTQSGGFQGVDRLTVDTGFITLGNQQKFPPLLSLGRMVLPFGTSTGHPVTDALSIGSALSVDAFEMRHNAISLNFGAPTPQLGPRKPPVYAPTVRPVAIYPVIEHAGLGLGYKPPPQPPLKPKPVVTEPTIPPYSLGIYLYEGNTPGGNLKHWGSTVGYRAKGTCGKRYEEISGTGLCPWGFDAALSYNSSVFNSLFLETEYDTFLSQIGRIPGVAASVRSALGPFSVVAEWNSATRAARFRDDTNAAIVMKPSAWQLSLGYQFGWNPWVKEIGQQGTYVSLAYSRSKHLFGVMKMFDTAPVRAGALPKERILLTFGEWVVDGVRFAVEFSRNYDYGIGEGGTGRSTNGVAAMLTYAW